MRTTLVFVFALVLATAITLIPPSSGGSGARDGEIPIRLALWAQPFEDYVFRDVFAAGYEALAPVTIDYQRHSGVEDKYSAWHATGDGAEVMRLGIDYYPQFARQGIIEPLTEYINDERYGLTEEMMSAFPERLIEAITIDGELYALPQDNAVYGLYYNKAIFDAYNAEHPGDPIGYPDVTWTWADVRAAARKLTGKRGELFGEAVSASKEEVRGIELHVWAWCFLNFYAQAGGEIWSEDELTTLVASPEGVEALEFLGSLIQDGSWSPRLGGGAMDATLASFTESHEGGPHGSLAMKYGGSWWAPSIERLNPDLEFAIAPTPRGERARILSGCVLWGISVHAKEKATGWRMIRWMVQEEQAQDYWNLRVAPPAHLGVINSDAFHSTNGVPDGQGGYLIQPMPEERYDDRAAWLTYTWQPHPVTGEVPGFIASGLYQQKLQNELNAMLNTYLANPDSVDPMEALEAVAAEVHRQIDDDRKAAGLEEINRSGTGSSSESDG